MVKIVTDSSGDIPYQVIQELDISVVPAHILFGRKKYRDMYEISINEFYKHLETEYFHPVTTQASPLEFYREFRQLERLGQDILCITLPDNLSALKESALIAADQIKDVNLHIYDSRGVSAAQGMIVIHAARLARMGYSLDEIVKQLNYLQPRTTLYSVASTLDYLVRGNRIGVARGKLGSILGINPILKIYDGEVESVAQSRGMEPAYETIMELLKADYSTDEPMVAMTLHSLNTSGASLLADRAREEFNIVEMIPSKIGATIGANVGPGAAGLALSPSLAYLQG